MAKGVDLILSDGTELTGVLHGPVGGQWVLVTDDGGELYIDPADIEEMEEF